MNHMAAPLPSFMSVLTDFTSTKGEKEVYTKCISQIFFPHDDPATKELSLENFQKLLKWFGPIKQGEMHTILDVIYDTIRKPWFFGEMSREEAETRLEPYKVTSFYFCFFALLHFNHSCSGFWDMSAYVLYRESLVTIWFVSILELLQLLKPARTQSPESKMTHLTPWCTLVSNLPRMAAIL